MKTTLLILLALASLASAFPVKFRWNANPPAESVTEYRIYQLPTEGPRILKATITATAEPKQVSGPLEVESGQRYVVTAANGTFESEPSDPLTIPVKPSKPGQFEITLEGSADLTEWVPIAKAVIETDAPTKLFRTRITTLPIP